MAEKPIDPALFELIKALARVFMRPTPQLPTEPPRPDTPRTEDNQTHR